MKNTYSLKNEHHDFNIERFKARLMGKCCVVFICMVQIIIRIIILATEPKLDHRSRVAHVISLPFVFLIAVIIVFEYILFRRIGPKVMNYAKLIDIILIVLFTIEWLITLFIIFIRFGNMNPPSLSPSAVFAITNFGWRTLFLLFLIQGWKLIILPPTIAMMFTLGFTLYYTTTGPKLILMACLSQTLYTIIMLYFLDKIKWKEIFTNAQQERWMQINQFVLNNIPENIIILELGGGVNFVSDYCKAFMDSVHLSSNPQDLFTHITQLYLLSDNQPTSPCNTSRQCERATTFNLLPDPADVSIQMPSAKKVDTLQDLIENFKTLINQSRLQEKEFLIYNGKLQVEDHHVKSIEIKISFMQQYAQDFIILIIRDTTHRDLLVTLEETNKYKDQLLASVSHELRAPLNGNINLLESAIQEKSVPTRIKDGLLTPALRSSKFLLHLINDILDMSQIKAQKLRLIFKPGKLQETLKDTLQLVELHAKKKGLELCLNIHPEIIRSSVCTDHVRLSQIVLNLLNNAIKFTQKGSIVLSAMPTEDPMLLKISVQDSGMGMAQESIKKLFLDYTHIEFAERKEINPTGVGLGLSIAYNLAKLLGPQTQKGITVESVLSAGSTFSFLIENKIDRLETQDVLTNKSGSDRSSRFVADELETFQPKNCPRLSQCLSLNVLSQHCPSNPQNSEKLTKCSCAKILIVDDNPFNTMAFDAVLGALNFKCDSVFNGQSAIEKIIERQTTFCGSNCKPYSVVFMDQEMPGMNGSETVEEIRKLEIQGLVSTMKIVGCTAHGSTEEVERFMEAGLDMCIHKPITASEIQKILKNEDVSSPLS